MEQLKTLILAMLLLCITTAGASAQEVDERLWATWELKTVEITAGNLTTTYSLAQLRADMDKMPRNIFTSISFFDGGQVRVQNSETEFGSEKASLGGVFTVKDGKLLVTMWGDEEPLTFDYTIENNMLKLRYPQNERPLSLTYYKD